MLCRYTPIGFTKKHEFTEADSNVSLDVIDQWLDNVAAARAHIDPNEIPWSALQKLLSESLYGGRVDHPFDQVSHSTQYSRRKVALQRLST